MPAKSLGQEFSNEVAIVRNSYKFSVDGGAISALPIFTATADMVIVGIHALVKVACTSGGSATVAVGVTGTADLFVTAVEGAVANLTLNAILKPNAVGDLPVRLASGSSVLMTIATAALTAGEIEYVIRYMKA